MQEVMKGKPEVNEELELELEIQLERLGVNFNKEENEGDKMEAGGQEQKGQKKKNLEIDTNLINESDSSY